MAQPGFLRRFVKSGVQSGSIMIVADSFTQMYIEDRKFKGFEDVKEQLTNNSLLHNLRNFSLEKSSDLAKAKEVAATQQQHGQEVARDEHNVERTMRWALVGLTLHGPYFFLTFGIIDKLWGAATGLGTVIGKTMTAQIFAFPVYLGLLFSYISAMEGLKDEDKFKSNVETKVKEAFIAGAFYWPLANMFNFKFATPALRVPMVAFSAGIWSAFLSWLNANQDEVKAFVTTVKATTGLGLSADEEKASGEVAKK